MSQLTEKRHYTRSQAALLQANIPEELRAAIHEEALNQPPCSGCGWGIDQAEARAGYTTCEHCA